jgi:serine phosphatase RsbU (regulator of sigma subunit)
MQLEIFDPQNYYWNPWAVPVFFVSIFTIALGLFVWIHNRKSLINIAYLFVNFSVGIWLFATVWMFASKSIDLGLFWNKIIWMAVPFISPSFYFYSVVWLGLKKQKRITIFAFILAFVFAVLAVGSKYFIIGGKKHFWGVYPEYGILSYFFLLFYLVFMTASFLNLSLSYMKTDSLTRKRQIRYVFIGFIIGYFASVDYLPALKIEIYPFGYVFVFFLICTIAFTIIRYRLMDIDTVIHRTILWMLTSSVIFVPISVIIYLQRPWLANLNWIQLAFLATLLVYTYLYLYPKMQPKIDHLFRRRKYDYYQILSEIGEKIGTELNINSVITRLFKELKEVLYIRNGLVLVQLLGRQDYTEAGSTGYGTLQDTLKDRLVTISYNTELCQWLNKRQKALEREQIEIDPQYEPIKEETLAWLSQNMIEILIPIVMEHKVNGLIGIGKKENLQAYTAKDIELLEKMGRQLGITIDNALHHEDIVEKGRLDEELKLGREIQMNLLPRQIPCVPNLSLQGMMTPAKEIGGDYYDFIPLPNKEELAIVIGDVSGKGVAAGLLMSMVKATIHAFSQEGASPKQILLRTNAFLHQHVGSQKFMTLLYLKWQSQSRTLSYSSAGHEHILICRAQGPATTGRTATGVVEAIVSGGFMLGMIADIDKFLEERQIRLGPSDKILLYTDGVTEAENASGERFGLEQLKESFQRHSQKSTGELMQAVKDEVYTFIGAHPQYDDITLVVMEAQ